MSQKGYSFIPDRKAILFEKRHLLILVLIGLLFTLGATVGIKRVVDGHSPRVEICRNALSSDRPGYTYYVCPQGKVYVPLRYQRTDFVPFSKTVRVHFTDGTNLMWCTMERHDSEWVVTGAASTIASMCP
jgi:hypothetical protein